MKRILLMVCRNIFIVPWLYLKLCWYASHTNSIPVEKKMALLKTIVGYANRGGNVEIKAYGVENIPSEGSFMFFPNHQGLYDVLAMIETSPIFFSVVVKKELMKIGFLRTVFKIMGAYAIDREDVRQSMKVIQSVSEDVKNGKSFLIFPEGTRNRNESDLELLEFHEGSFRLATKTNCLIVPIAMNNTVSIFEKQFPKIRKNHVVLEYCKPFRPSELSKEDQKHIGEYTRTLILETLKKNEPLV